jgi:deoxyribodipyrimidine photo-lyase
MMSKKVGIHWFRKDLRIKDNASLASIASQVDELVCVYLYQGQSSQTCITVDSKDEAIGKHRINFINQSLIQLQDALNGLNQRLVVLPVNGISSLQQLLGLVDELNATHVSAEWHCGFNERQQWRALQDTLKESAPDVQFIQENSSTLYDSAQFPFSVENMPGTFSPFRKKLEKYCEVKSVAEKLHSLPRMSDLTFEKSMCPSTLAVVNNHYPKLAGGELSAHKQLEYYLWNTDHISKYKETRNGLDGWDFSSKLSAWLSIGCVSARQVFAELKNYESARVKNDSTYWLFFELLWREFFHWHHFVHAERLFSASGVQGIARSRNFEPNKFQQWQQGETGFPIVDACMRQLSKTGFISNRGRQLVASCFVHELGLDWRYGAKYFEYQLIDFDVASNWGNWQYLGGVGADPRGHRQFNLLKQTEIYDPDHEFINQWSN